VNLEVLGCLEIAARAYVKTHGAFDPAFRSTAGGTRPSAMDFLMLSRPESDTPEGPAEYLVGFDPAAADHGFESADIDLGGIGKGFALDHAAELLEDWSVQNFLLNSGTSTVLARGGGPEGKGWTVGVSGDYREMTGVHTTDLVNVSLSGSGTAVKGEHIKNPKTGEPAQALAAWAKARNAAWTDAISTGLMIMQKETARTLMHQGKVAQGIVVYPDGFEIFGDW
jgi:thiamine biosynthesis lipoprotein ApbE